MAKIVKSPKPKRVDCNACGAVIEYLPEEVEETRWTEIDGAGGGYKWIKCPRPGCLGQGIIARW